MNLFLENDTVSVRCGPQGQHGPASWVQPGCWGPRAMGYSVCWGPHPPGTSPLHTLPYSGQGQDKKGLQPAACLKSGNFTRNLPYMASAILRGSRMSNGGLSQQCNKYENLWRNSQRGRGHMAEKAQSGFCASPLTLHRPGVSKSVALGTLLGGWDTGSRGSHQQDPPSPCV